MDDPRVPKRVYRHGFGIIYPPLDFRVLAEFVETVEQKEALEHIGCLLYQGYLYSPAIDKDSLISPGNKK